MNETKENDVKN